MLASNIIPVFIVAVIAVLIFVATRRDKKPKAPAADQRVHLTTLPARTLPDDQPAQLMRFGPDFKAPAPGAPAAWEIPYLLRHVEDTSAGLARRTTRNCLRVSGEIDFGAYHGAESHIAVTLRNRTDLRSATLFDPDTPGAVSLGHGVIFGLLGAGQVDYPADAPLSFAAVVEQFDKRADLRTLLPETQSPPLPQRVWFSIVSKRDGDRMTLRYVLAGAGGYFFDSGEVPTQHYMPLDGDDLTFAMFPLKPGTVHIGALECVWSESPLEPALPVWLEAA